jgi:type IV secretion system protein VirB6
MFTWVGNQLDGLLSSYVLDVVTALMSAIAPMALTLLTMWILLYGWAVLRHEVPETVPTFAWRVVRIGLVLAVALQSTVYLSNVSDTANALATGATATFLPSGVDPTTVTTPYAMLDAFNDSASAQVADIMREASMFRLDLFLAAGLFSIGTVAFLCIALFVVTLSKLFLAFVIAVGPLFVFCLAWRPTRRFFDSWLSMALNAVVLTWFAFFALGLSAYVGNHMFTAIQAGGGFLGTTLNVLGESTRYCVLMILMAILCFQAPNLASSLTGGAAIHQGLQIVQNGLAVIGLRSALTATAPASNASVGANRAGLGAPYAVSPVRGSVRAAFAPDAPRAASAPSGRNDASTRVAAYRRATRHGQS